MANFGGFMNDPAAQMGLQMGQSAMKVGQEYVEQNVSAPYNPSATTDGFRSDNPSSIATSPSLPSNTTST